MQDANIEKLNPLKAEIVSLVENIKATVASGDAVGLDLLKEKKKTLQSKRTDTVKYLKGEREGFIAAQKFIIGFEKDMLKIIAEVEDPITEEINKIEEAERREERRSMLPERKEKLAKIGISPTDDYILDMDEKQFAAYYIEKKEIYLNEQQAKIDAENKRIQDEADEKQRQADLEAARIEGAKQAEKAAEEARIKKEKEDEANRKKIEKRKKYIEFRTQHGFAEETKADFIERNDGEKIILFRKVGEFKL